MKRPGEATTIAIVATDAALSQAQAQRMAMAAHDGMARAIVPAIRRSTAIWSSPRRPGRGPCPTRSPDPSPSAMPPPPVWRAPSPARSGWPSRCRATGCRPGARDLAVAEDRRCRGADPVRFGLPAATADPVARRTCPQWMPGYPLSSGEAMMLPDQLSRMQNRKARVSRDKRCRSGRESGVQGNFRSAEPVSNRSLQVRNGVSPGRLQRITSVTAPSVSRTIQPSRMPRSPPVNGSQDGGAPSRLSPWGSPVSCHGTASAKRQPSVMPASRCAASLRSFAVAISNDGQGPADK